MDTVITLPSLLMASWARLFHPGRVVPGDVGDSGVAVAVERKEHQLHVLLLHSLALGAASSHGPSGVKRRCALPSYEFLLIFAYSLEGGLVGVRRLVVE